MKQLHHHNRLLQISACISLMVASLIFPTAHAKKYTVGGSQGWNLGVDYQSWASQFNFQQGDTLYFKYQAGAHNVMQVSQSDYNTCTFKTPITKDDGEGNSTVTLQSSGSFFYICGVPGHCPGGMKD
ncbi:hypothetical protein GOP47_0020132 [Adiantum capillus-veneris]|uniref:Phytocyanin domain-containing protein n=1 Tax=Adiantum capillus-veneris TaxID=13818 RepID=A0A9D4Z994_ADICA|nr:hypothetical protein GOP47_0020132 [Adiantum capillus-veneris]